MRSGEDSTSTPQRTAECTTRRIVMNTNPKIRLIGIAMAAAITFGLTDGIATMFAATQATQLAAAHRAVVASAR